MFYFHYRDTNVALYSEYIFPFYLPLFVSTKRNQKLPIGKTPAGVFFVTESFIPFHNSHVWQLVIHMYDSSLACEIPLTRISVVCRPQY